MIKKICCLIIAACIFLTAQAQAEEKGKTLTIAADIWCPINCDPAASELGIGIDLAKKIFEPLGYQVNYIVTPWARALDDARQGRIDAVVGANTTDDPTLIFPKNAITNISDDFYVRAENPLQYRDISSLSDQRLGIIKDYGYDAHLTEFIAGQMHKAGMIQAISGDTALEQNIKKLLAKRIDVLVESSVIMDYKIKTDGLKGKMRWVGGIPQGNVFVAFSPALTSSALHAQQFDEGMTRLKTSGELSALYQSYGLAAP